MHERVRHRLAQRHGRIIGHIFPERALDNRCVSGVSRNGGKHVLNHERDRTQNGLRIHKTLVITYSLRFCGPGVRRKGHIETWEELLRKPSHRDNCSKRRHDCVVHPFGHMQVKENLIVASGAQKPRV